MKIMHVITRLILGGAQQNTVMTCRNQVESGHAVSLAYGPIYGPEGSLLGEARSSGAELVELPAMRRAILPGHDLACYYAIRRLIRRVKPDVIHTHSSKAGIIGRLAGWHEQVPAVIHTVHGLPFHHRQSRLAYRSYVQLERIAAKRCHHLIAITPAMVDAFRDNNICSPQKCTVIPSAVDLTLFDSVDREAGAAVRREWGIDARAQVVGILARLDRLKGHDDLLDIFSRLRSRLTNLHMLFIGDGWYRAELERKIRLLRLRSRVTITGLVPHHEALRLLTAVDVKVLPSYQEGQSRTLIEALLCGCGIVAYDVGGMRSICIDGRTGRLVPLGNRNALAEAILWMFSRPEQRQKLIEAGNQHVRHEYDARKMYDDMEIVYRRVLGKSIRNE